MATNPERIELTVFAEDGSSIGRTLLVDPNIADRIAYPAPEWPEGPSDDDWRNRMAKWACEELLRSYPLFTMKDR